VADLPFSLSPDLSARLVGALDVEGKIPRVLEALGPMADRDILLIGGGELRSDQLTSLGARVTQAPELSDDGLARLDGRSFDAVVSYWSAFRDRLPEELEAAEGVLRPTGRVLILHDYGRDDVSQLRSPDLPEYTTWSRRDGWFLRTDFKLRVLHCWWTFESIDDAASFLGDAFGAAGQTVAAGLKRPRLSYNVAIYHRARGGSEAE
jgi:hypothetical protein